MLIPIATGIGLVLAVAACGSAPPTTPEAAEPEHRVVATWVADDGSVIALNVVLGRAADPRRIPELARRLRAAHPLARVIVTFFSSTSGPERFEIGHVPSGGDPIPVGSRPSTALATFDFPAPSPSTTVPTAGAP